MALVLLPGYRITEANGTVVSGGKLYVFEAGTSNPRDVYTDSALTTAHAHPVVADAGGLLPDIWTAEDDLKVRITDASDVTIWEIDDYSTGASSSNATDVLRTPLSKIADYTVLAADENSIITMDASSGDKTVTASSTTLGAGFVIGVKNVGASGNVLIQGTGAETIDGAANRSLTSQYEFIDLVSRGAAGWFVLASQGASDVSVTVQQADASTDGELIFEDELGARRWVVNHETATDSLKLDRYNSSGVFVDTIFATDNSNGVLTFTNDTYFTTDAFATGATVAKGTVNRVILTAGSGTWTKPTGLKSLLVRGAGGGRTGGNGGSGGGGTLGDGGGSGGSGEKMFLASALSATEAWVVGGADTTTATTFAGLSFAGAPSTDAGIAVATGGDVNIPGARKMKAGEGALGGSTIFGDGGRAGNVTLNDGTDGRAPGTGGGGGFNGGATAGGDGQDGILILDEYY